MSTTSNQDARSQIVGMADTFQKNIESLSRRHHELVERLARLQQIRWSKANPGSWKSAKQLRDEIKLEAAYLQSSFRVAAEWHGHARHLGALVRKHLPNVAGALVLVKPYASNWIVSPPDWAALRAELERIADAADRSDEASTIADVKPEAPQATPEPQVASEPAKEEYDPLDDELDGQSLLIYQYIRTYGRRGTHGTYVVFDDLRLQRKFWKYDDPDDQTIVRALRRLQSKLNSIGQYRKRLEIRESISRAAIC